MGSGAPKFRNLFEFAVFCPFSVYNDQTEICYDLRSQVYASMLHLALVGEGGRVQETMKFSVCPNLCFFGDFPHIGDSIHVCPSR